MQPELISKGTLTFVFVTALCVAAVTIAVALANAVASVRRVQTAHPEPGTPQYVVGAQIIRGAVAGVVIGVACGWFSFQALTATRAGTFALIEDWFSVLFLAAVYVPLAVRFVLTLCEFRDRRLLDELRRAP